MQILLIEDQVKLADNIAHYLQIEGYDVKVSHSGSQGLILGLGGSFSLIILDLNLPDKDGLQVCQELRSQDVSTPIIMLTARTGSQQAVIGLKAGADDYLPKPFDLAELAARIKALLRRVDDKPAVLTHHNLSLDTASCLVTLAGKPISLAPREYDLLEYLLRNKGAVSDRSTLIEKVWDDDQDLLFSQTVDVHVAYLRRKCGKDLITTVPGKGYMIID